MSRTILWTGAGAALIALNVCLGAESIDDHGRRLPITVPNCTEDEYVDWSSDIPVNCGALNTCPPLVCVPEDCVKKYGELKSAFNNFVSVLVRTMYH
jgi:hypothetical protein